MTSSSDNTASGTASEFKVETEPEKFDSLHPYPDIYYDDEEDVTDEEEDWCGECDSPLDECVCNYCSHGQPDGADCDQMPHGSMGCIPNRGASAAAKRKKPHYNRSEPRLKECPKCGRQTMEGICARCRLFTVNIPVGYDDLNGDMDSG